MNEIQVARWDRMLRRWADIRGQVVAPTLAPEIMPTITIEPDRPEQDFLRETGRYMSAGTLAAVAGQYSTIALRNDSLNRLVVLEWYRASAACGMDRVLAFVGGVAISGVPTATDSRLDGQIGACFFYGANAVGPVMVPMVVFAATGVYQYPLILAPGAWVTWQTSAVNTALTINAMWRERVWEQGER